MNESTEIKDSQNCPKEMELIDVVISAMRDRKAENIMHLDMDNLSKSVCSSFIITSAASTTQVRAIADNVEDEVFTKLGNKVWKRQGDENALWIILDYGSVVVHVFQTEWRYYYALEDLWADADVVSIPEEKTA
jgi:ribosome-associated protein